MVHYKLNNDNNIMICVSTFAGYGMYDINAEKGRRAGSYEAFIKPILSRKNLSIYRYAQVTKVYTK